MKKPLVSAIVCMTACLVLPALAATNDAPPKAPADGYVMHKGDKKTVIFNHSTHTSAACASCHHPVEGKEDYRPCSTAGCHDKIGAKEKEPNSYHRVIHTRQDLKFQTCMSCHLKSAGDDKAKKKELTACAKSKCHP